MTHAPRTEALRQIEARMSAAVIELHDAARTSLASDVGVAGSARRIASDLSLLVTQLRRLLPHPYNHQGVSS